MRVEKNVPEIRFEGFSGEWKISQLSELALFNPKEELPVTFKYVDLESVKGTSLLGYREELKESAPSRAQRLAKKGDVFFQTVRPYQKNNYLFNMEEIDFVFSTGYAQLRPYYDGNFLLNLIQRDSFVKDVLDNCTGTSYPAINASILASLEVISPEGKEEQTAIGNTFQILDNLINQHQQKHDKLSNIKKAMLDKMFPKQGETIPEIRFKGFSAEWEEKKLGELAEIVRGASPRPIEDPKWFDKSSTVGWLRIRDVTEQDGRIHFLEQRISKLGQEKTRVLFEPHLLVSIAASVGKPVINYVETGVHDGFLIFKKPLFELEFMYQWLKSFQEAWQQYGQPGSQVNLNSDIVKGQVVRIPSNAEQLVIGNYFQKLDALINQHQQQITKLNNIKQACLSKMFV
ncbi:restriction endonuclease subunit S [Shewanella oncorhynchi]|uniref:restriction endonuclease subunit S n=1 Tax=Shewanella oncorhynchi TaxID=2726434 RepID=UPI003D7C1009